MEYVLQFQLSIFAAVAIIMLLLKIYYSEEVYSYSNRLFRRMSFSVLFVMGIEFLSWVFDGKSGTYNHILNHASNTMLFIISPVTIGFWVSYIHYKIYGDMNALKRAFWFQYPFIISFVLGVINIFYPIVFKIPENTNLFTRLPLISINYVLIYINVFYSIFISIKERNKIKPMVLVAVVSFVVLPFIASIVQVLSFGLIIMYPMLTLSIIVVYLFLETTCSSIDYLTGIYSRSRFDDYVLSKINRNEEFTVIMLDLDDYKMFNDKYGHIKGDKVLIMYANLMTHVFGDKSFSARYGGDEFAVIEPTTDEKQLLKYDEDMKKGISISNDQIFRKVRFSFGYCSRSKENQFEYDQLLQSADKMMYENKSRNKNFKRRKEDRKVIL